MVGKPSVEARLLVEDARYEAYRADLQARYDKTVEVLLRPITATDHVRMARLAAQAAAFKYALGLPAELEKTDPGSPDS